MVMQLLIYQFFEMLKFHNVYKSIFTVATKLHNFKNPYGVLKTKGFYVKNFEEKPVISSKINTGIYILNPKLLKK